MLATLRATMIAAAIVSLLALPCSAFADEAPLPATDAEEPSGTAGGEEAENPSDAADDAADGATASKTDPDSTADPEGNGETASGEEETAVVQTGETSSTRVTVQKAEGAEEGPIPLATAGEMEARRKATLADTGDGTGAAALAAVAAGSLCIAAVAKALSRRGKR